MKKTIIAALVTGVVALSSVNALAAEKGIEENNTAPVNVIDLSSSTLSQEGVEIGDVMTFDEVVKSLAAEHNISINQASQQVIEGTKSQSNLRSAEISPYSATYRTISQTVNVTSSYKPQIKYYMQTDESTGSFRAIKAILDVSLNRIYNGISKVYAGKVYTHLEDPNKIFWRMDGDFYGNGTMTVNSGVNITVGKAATVTFGISSSSNHYSAVYQEGRTTF